MGKKKAGTVTKMSLGDFLSAASSNNSWASEEFDDALPTSSSSASYASPTSSSGWKDDLRGANFDSNQDGHSRFGSSFRRSERSGDFGFDSQDMTPIAVDMSRLPSQPPFSAYVGNLPYDVVPEELSQLFPLPSSQIVNVNIIKGPDGKTKGFAYVEFASLDSLKEALGMNGTISLKQRRLRLDIASPNAKESSGGGQAFTGFSRRATPLEDTADDSQETRRPFAPSSRGGGRFSRSTEGSSDEPVKDVWRRTEPMEESDSHHGQRHGYHAAPSSQSARRPEYQQLERRATTLEEDEEQRPRDIDSREEGFRSKGRGEPLGLQRPQPRQEDHWKGDNKFVELTRRMTPLSLEEKEASEQQETRRHPEREEENTRRRDYQGLKRDEEGRSDESRPSIRPPRPARDVSTRPAVMALSRRTEPLTNEDEETAAPSVDAPHKERRPHKEQEQRVHPAAAYRGPSRDGPSRQSVKEPLERNQKPQQENEDGWKVASGHHHHGATAPAVPRHQVHTPKPASSQSSSKLTTVLHQPSAFASLEQFDPEEDERQCNESLESHGRNNDSTLLA